MVFGVWEALAPDRRQGLPRSSRWFSNLGLGALSNALLIAAAPFTSLGVSMWAQHHQMGILRLMGLDPLVGGILALPLLDLALWAQHVATHKVPFLWRLHRVHHLDTDLDVTTSARFHPLEILLSQVWMSLVVVALGVLPEMVVVHSTLVAAFAQFNHANFRLPYPLERRASRIFATPTFHRVHHSVIAREANTHFGNILSVWDHLFNTVTPRPAGGGKPLALGVDPWRHPRWQRLDRLLLHPALSASPTQSFRETQP